MLVNVVGVGGLKQFDLYCAVNVNPSKALVRTGRGGVLILPSMCVYVWDGDVNGQVMVLVSFG